MGVPFLYQDGSGRGPGDSNETNPTTTVGDAAGAVVGDTGVGEEQELDVVRIDREQRAWRERSARARARMSLREFSDNDSDNVSAFGMFGIEMDADVRLYRDRLREFVFEVENLPERHARGRHVRYRDRRGEEGPPRRTARRSSSAERRRSTVERIMREHRRRDNVRMYAGDFEPMLRLTEMEEGPPFADGTRRPPPWQILSPQYDAGSLDEETKRVCLAAVDAVQTLMRRTSRRVHLGYGEPDAMGRACQYLEVVFGMRGVLSERQLNSSQFPRNREEMMTALLNRHYHNPQWAQEDTADSVLEEFHGHAQHGDLVGILNLLPRMKYPLSHPGSGGSSALLLACMHGRSEAAQLLIDLGHRVDTVGPGNSTPLSLAAIGGYVDLVRYFCQTTPGCIHEADDNGNVPLHHAAQGNHADCCDVLIRHGADMNVVNKKNEKPIDVARMDSHAREILSSSLAGLERVDREVLLVFDNHDDENGQSGFTTSDVMCLSMVSLHGPDVQNALERLVAAGYLYVVDDHHWKLVRVDDRPHHRPGFVNHNRTSVAS